MTTKLPNGYEAVVGLTKHQLLLEGLPFPFTFIAKASEITEEQAREIVGSKLKEYNETVFKDYVNNWYMRGNALMSFETLLRSKNLEAETTLIIKTITTT